MNAVLLGSLVVAQAAPEPLEISTIAPEWHVEVSDEAPPTGPWWEVFADPALSEIVEAGLAANPDLEAAQGRILTAKGARVVAFAPLVPGLSFDVSTSGQPLSIAFRCGVGAIDTTEFFDPTSLIDALVPPIAEILAEQGGFPPPDPPTTTPPAQSPPAEEDSGGMCWSGSALLNLRWSVDLFGRGILGHKAAAYEVEAARGDLEALRLMLTATLASTYLDVVSARSQVQVLEEQLAAQSDLLEILQLRFSEGNAGGLEVLQQRQVVASTRAALPTARLAATSQGNALAALLGRGPTAMPEVASALPEPTELPPVGTPAQLLQRRPDLRAASDRVVAARARHAGATRGLLPTVAISANAGTSYAVGDEWSSIGTWGLGGTLSVPIFNGGAAHGAIQQAAGAELSMVRALDTALLNAVRDVEGAVALEIQQAERHQAVTLQVEAARQAFGEAQQRYLTGIDSFLNVLAAQGALQAAELSLIQAHRDRLAARVQLWTALGGSTASGATP